MCQIFLSSILDGEVREVRKKICKGSFTAGTTKLILGGGNFYSVSFLVTSGYFLPDVAMFQQAWQACVGVFPNILLIFTMFLFYSIFRW